MTPWSHEAVLHQAYPGPGCHWVAHERSVNGGTRGKLTLLLSLQERACVFVISASQSTPTMPCDFTPIRMLEVNYIVHSR